MGVIGEPVEISSGELAHMLASPELSSAALLVLDCRPFLSFSRAHVRRAHNAAWNALLRRRCSRGSDSGARLAGLLADRALVTRVQRGEFRHVVVMDEKSRAVTELQRESLASLLLRALHAEVPAGVSRVSFLQGEMLPADVCAPLVIILVP